MLFVKSDWAGRSVGEGGGFRSVFVCNGLGDGWAASGPLMFLLTKKENKNEKIQG